VSRVASIVFALLLAALSAACAFGEATGAWEKPGMTEESKAKDMFNCRDYAHQRIQSRAVRETETQHSRAVAAQDVARNDEMAAERRMQEAEHLQLERQIFDDCMRANGYNRAKQGES
jgi:hypothetical protein